MELGCENCKRKDPTGEYSVIQPSSLKFTFHQVNNLIKRRGPFVFFHVDSNSDDKISLCVECSEFYTNREKEGRLFANTWPSFIWNLLNDQKNVCIWI